MWAQANQFRLPSASRPPLYSEVPWRRRTSRWDCLGQAAMVGAGAEDLHELAEHCEIDAYDAFISWHDDAVYLLTFVGRSGRDVGAWFQGLDLGYRLDAASKRADVLVPFVCAA